MDRTMEIDEFTRFCITEGGSNVPETYPYPLGSIVQTKDVLCMVIGFEPRVGGWMYHLLTRDDGIPTRMSATERYVELVREFK